MCASFLTKVRTLILNFDFAQLLCKSPENFLFLQGAFDSKQLKCPFLKTGRKNRQKRPEKKQHLVAIF